MHWANNKHWDGAGHRHCPAHIAACPQRQEWARGRDGADTNVIEKELTSPFSLLHVISHKQIWEVIL